MITEKEIVNEILKDFDFKSVHKMFVKNNYKWNGQVPSVEEIIEASSRLVVSILNDRQARRIGMGRLEVTRTKEGKLDEIIELRFIPVRSSIYCPNYWIRGA